MIATLCDDISWQVTQTFSDEVTPLKLHIAKIIKAFKEIHFSYLCTFYSIVWVELLGWNSQEVYISIELFGILDSDPEKKQHHQIYSGYQTPLPMNTITVIITSQRILI